MSTVDKDVVVPVCANCGKEGSSDNMNTCNKCKMVKYCNAACKKKHRRKHKIECEEHIRLAAEHAAELHEKELFKQPPPAKDCPICFVCLPTPSTGWRYYTCCGKTICSGCIYAPVYDNQGNAVAEKKCAFCRVPFPKSVEEENERLKKRVEVNDLKAMHCMGTFYRDGERDFPQDYAKALELWRRAGELGDADAYCSIGYAYKYGNGVEVDKKKAKYYYELAAIGGSVPARHNLGSDEGLNGNMDRALKHFMIAVRNGSSDSLKTIKGMYSKGHATKDDYTTALQAYQEYLVEIKNPQRDKAAAARENFRYC